MPTDRNITPGEPRGFITLDLRIQCEIFVSFVEPTGANHEGHFELFSARRKKQGCLLIDAVRGLCHTEKNETNYSSCTLEMLPLKCKFNYIYQTETVGSAQSANSFTDVNAEICLTGLAVHRVQRSYSQRSHVNSLKLFLLLLLLSLKVGSILASLIKVT